MTTAQSVHFINDSALVSEDETAPLTFGIESYLTPAVSMPSSPMLPPPGKKAKLRTTNPNFFHSNIENAPVLPDMLSTTNGENGGNRVRLPPRFTLAWNPRENVMSQGHVIPIDYPPTAEEERSEETDLATLPYVPDVQEEAAFTVKPFSNKKDNNKQASHNNVQQQSKLDVAACRRSSLGALAA